MEPQVQKWRDHFVQCEADQLHRFPLRELNSPLEFAQYEMARQHLTTQWERSAKHERIVALCADEPTRHAFFDFFGSKKHDWFCFKRDEWPSIFAGRSRGSGLWPFQTQHHEFRDCHSMETRELHQRLGEHFDELRQEALFLRSYGLRDASQAGVGGSDLWHWNGEELIHLPKYKSMWVS